jgi:hypothetical protein
MAVYTRSAGWWCMFMSLAPPTHPPTHTRTEERAPVRGSEFTTKAATIHGGSEKLVP